VRSWKDFTIVGTGEEYGDFELVDVEMAGGAERKSGFLATLGMTSLT
jgi:hypothetical protein